MYPRIRALRIDSDLNQTTVAKVLDMSQTGYSKYETGENDISPSLLVNLAYFYDVSVEYLLGISDSKEYYERTRQQTELYQHYRKAYMDLYKKKHSS